MYMNVIYIYIYICMYVCMYVCMCIYIYIYIYTHASLPRASPAAAACRVLEIGGGGSPLRASHNLRVPACLQLPVIILLLALRKSWFAA